MPHYTQANRAMAFTSPLGADALLLEKFTGTEALSELFHFHLDLLAEKPIDFDKLLGQKAAIRLSLPNGTRRHFHGIISSLSQGPRVLGTGGKATLIRYQAELVPELWLLARRVQSRIFQHVSVPDILKRILHDEWALDVDLPFQIEGTLLPRNYCVQYRESDFAFISRLMEEEGIAYFFAHTADSHRMILTDHTDDLPSLPQRPTVLYEEIEGGERQEPRIRSWVKRQELRSYKYTLRDYCFEKPEAKIEAHQVLQKQVKVGEVSHRLGRPHLVKGTEMLEAYDYPGAFVPRFDAITKDGQERPAELEKLFAESERTANLRVEQEAVQALCIRGGGDGGHFTPGYQFTLDRHFDANGAYLLVRVEHAGSLEGVYTTNPAGTPVYQNTFQCLPADLLFRPRPATPRPKIEGTQTAVVAGIPGQDLFLDKHGRVKVQFHWDREGKNNADSSCWVRVGQVWAGKRWGAFFWPRVGHEVIVSFEEGDPDRPIVVGSVYNQENPPPVNPHEEGEACGFKSCTLGGDPTHQFNCVVFHDRPPHEHLEMHSENHESITSETTKRTYVPGPHLEFAGGSTLPLVGSGGGGGFADVLGMVELGELNNKDMGMYEWLQETFPGKYTNISGDLTAVVMLGSKSDQVFGPRYALVADPEDLAAQLPFLRTLAGIGHGLVGALLMGAPTTGLVIGTNNTFNYLGPVLSIRRGEALTVAEDSFFHTKPPMSAEDVKAQTISRAVMAVSLLAAATSAIGHYMQRKELQPANAKDPKDLYKVGVPKFLFSFIYGRLLGILAVLEDTYSHVKKDVNKVRLGAILNARKTMETALRLDGAALRTAKFHAEKAASDAKKAAEDAVSWLAKAAGLKTPTEGNSSTVVSGDYQVLGKNVSLAAYNPNLMGFANVNIVAVGDQTPLDKVGFVSIIGSGDVTLSSGAAAVRAVNSAPNRGLVTVDGGELGKVLLQTGAPIVGPQIELTPSGITLSFGPSKLTVGAKGIKMTYGPNSIECGAKGVSLQGLLIDSDASLQSRTKAIRYQTQEAEEIFGAAVHLFG